MIKEYFDELKPRLAYRQYGNEPSLHEIIVQFYNRYFENPEFIAEEYINEWMKLYLNINQDDLK